MNTTNIALLAILYIFISSQTGLSKDTNATVPFGTDAFKRERAAAVTKEKEKQVLRESLISEEITGPYHLPTRIYAAAKVDNQRKELIEMLLSILDGTNTVREKYPAVIILGEYRASEAVPLLMRHLDWDHEAGRSGDGTVGGLMPAELWEEAEGPVRVALVKIGMPAIAPLLQRIVETDDAEIIQKCVSICNKIEGHDVTKFRLQGLLSKETDPKKKSRIHSALESLEKDEREQQEIRQRIEQYRNGNK